MKKLHIADLITAIRIPGSLLLLVLPVFSTPFMIVYLICGLSDMIDGTAARMTGSSGAFGERLDTIADFVFASAALARLLPCLSVPGWVWVWTAAIACIKLAAAAVGLIRCGKLIAVHSVLNKLTGLLLFLFPLSLRFIEMHCSAAVVCAAAAAAALQEGFVIVRTKPERRAVCRSGSYEDISYEKQETARDL